MLNMITVGDCIKTLAVCRQCMRMLRKLLQLLVQNIIIINYNQTWLALCFNCTIMQVG